MNEPILIYHPISLYTCNSLPSALRTHSIYFTILLHYPITATNRPANHRLPPRTVYPDHHSILLPPHIDGSTSNHIFTIHDTLASVHAYIYIYLNKYTLIWTNICLHPSILCTIYTVINKGLRLIDILPSHNACPDHLPSPINHATSMLPPTIIQIHLHRTLHLKLTTPNHSICYIHSVTRATDHPPADWPATITHCMSRSSVSPTHKRYVIIASPYPPYAFHMRHMRCSIPQRNRPTFLLYTCNFLPSILPSRSTYYHSVTLPIK